MQYLAIHYSERLAQSGAVASVGSRGDSYDNPLAEPFHGLDKTELIRHKGPWCGLDNVEHATLEYVDWFGHHRLHGELGMVATRRWRPRSAASPVSTRSDNQSNRAKRSLTVPHTAWTEFLRSTELRSTLAQPALPKKSGRGGTSWAGRGHLGK